jgi:hypothetical protein
VFFGGRKETIMEERKATITAEDMMNLNGAALEAAIARAAEIAASEGRTVFGSRPATRVRRRRPPVVHVDEQVLGVVR